MQDLGIDVLFKGTNFLRLLQGLWVSARISLISVVISILLGLLVGILMTFKNPILRAVLKVYLEIVRIMHRWFFCSSFILEPPESLDGTCLQKRQPFSYSVSGELLRWEISYEGLSKV